MIGIFPLSYFKKKNGGTNTFTPTNSYNWNSNTQFTNFKLAKQSLIAGTNRCIVGFAGDSTTVGVGASNIGYRGLSSSAKAVEYINSVSGRLFNAGFDSLCGTGNHPNADSIRVSLIGGAGFSGPGGFGGPTYQLYTAGDGIDITLKTPRVIDRIRVGVLQANSGTIDIGLDGSALSGSPTTNDNSSNIAYKTYNVPRQVYSKINIRCITGQPLLSGVDCYDSIIPRIDIFNGGSGGADASALTGGTTGYGPLQGLLALQPNLAFINYGINDGNSFQKIKSVYKSEILNGVQKLQAANCDVILLVTTPVIESSTMETTWWTQYRDALQEISLLQNVPVINLHDRYVSYTTQNSKTPSWMSDNLHPSALLYADLGVYFGNILLNI